MAAWCAWRTPAPVLLGGPQDPLFITGRTGVERTLLAAIKHNVAIYAIHTNLDNVITGVNAEIAERLGLKGVKVLDPKPGQLRKLVVFVPHGHSATLRAASSYSTRAAARNR